MSVIGYVNVSLEIWGCVLSFIMAACIFVSGSFHHKLSRIFLRLSVCNAIILLCDAAAWLFKGHLTPVCWWGVRISNFFVFALGYILLEIFTHYLTAYLGEYSQITRIPLYFIRMMCVISFLLVIVSQCNHMFYLIDAQNIYHRGEWFWLSQVGGICGMCVNAGLLIRYRKFVGHQERAALWSYILLPIFAMSIQIFIYGVALLNLATTIAILVMFLVLQVEQARRTKERELELAEMRISVMLSQIQPHFLCNTLSAIDKLCFVDPEEAHKAILMFSKYLRGNMDSLMQKELIPFEKEMEHTQQYLALEKLRFEERLNVVWDTPVTAFMLPVLTLQPIVENAVRHGIMKKTDGGTITIRTKETAKCWNIIVIDDGPGFNPKGLQSPGRSHTGISNVRERLTSMCGGRLFIDGIPGIGTAAVIEIPKGVEKS